MKKPELKEPEIKWCRIEKVLRSFRNCPVNLAPKTNETLNVPGIYIFKDVKTGKHLYVGANEDWTETGTLANRFHRFMRALMGTLNTDADGYYKDWSEDHSADGYLPDLGLETREEMRTYIVENIRYGYVKMEKDRSLWEHYLIEKYDPICNKDKSYIADMCLKKVENGSMQEAAQMMEFISNVNSSPDIADINDPIVASIFGSCHLSEFYKG